jgi:hypothetical protein
VKQFENGTAIVAGCAMPRGTIGARSSSTTPAWEVCSALDDFALKVHLTKAVLSRMPPLLLELWREQHPKGHEQTMLDYTVKTPEARSVPLFPSQSAGKR